MKKTLLLSAALAVSLSTFAQDYQSADYYMIGSNVNGQWWELSQADAKFEPKGDGIFEWDGDVLGTGFKINNGTWDNDNFNIGGDNSTLRIGEMYTYLCRLDGQDIYFADYVTELKNPKVILDVSNAPEQIFITVTGDNYDPGPKPDNEYLTSDYYMIGSNVNGEKWVLGAEDAKFVNKGHGVFEWNGQYLGTGFKINNGTWDNDHINLGSGEKLVLGETYYCVAAGSSGNIAFDGDFTGLNNPKVVLNVANAPDEITLVVTGEKEGITKWYITGTFNEWNIDDSSIAIEFTEREDGLYEAKGVELTSDTANEEGYNTFKITTTGWVDQYGQGDSGIEFYGTIYSGTLDKVSDDGGQCPIYHFGTFDVTWDSNSHIVSFNISNDPETPDYPDDLKWYLTGNFNGEEGTNIELLPAGGSKYVAENVICAQNPAETYHLNHFYIKSSIQGIYYGAKLNGHEAYYENYTPLFIDGITSGELYYQAPNWCYNDFYGTYTVEWDSDTHFISFNKVNDNPYYEKYVNSDYYIIGNDVNGKEWSLAEEDAKFVNMGNGIFEWNGEVLGAGFKINNGSWNDDYFNFGGNGYYILPDENYYCNLGGEDIYFAKRISEIVNPKVTLDVSNAPAQILITVTGEYVEPYVNSDYYIIGNDVNGKEWSLAEEDAKFVNMGNGIFEWNGEVLGTGFKINNGSWNDDYFNFGGNGDYILPDENYYCNLGGENIYFAKRISEIVNPKVTLDVSNAPAQILITVTGEYVEPIPENWALQCYIDGQNTYLPMKKTEDNKFIAENVKFAAASEEYDSYNRFTIRDNDNMILYCADETDGVIIEEDEPFAKLYANGTYWCYLNYNGIFNVEWDPTTQIITFNKIEDAEESELKWYIEGNINGSERTSVELKPVGGNKYVAENVSFTQNPYDTRIANQFFISSTFESLYYGAELNGDGAYLENYTPLFIDGITSGKLYYQSPNWCYNDFYGTYTVEWDFNTHVVSFNKVSDNPYYAKYAYSDYYIIGNDVNGKEWSLAEEDAKFVNMGNGIFEWNGEVLGTGFKINNGSWNDVYFMFGGNGDYILPDENYYCNLGGADIYFAKRISEIVNPKVTLDVSNAPAQILITVTGEYVEPIPENWALQCYVDGQTTYLPMKKTEDNKFIAENVKFAAASEEYDSYNRFTILDNDNQIIYSADKSSGVIIKEDEPFAKLYANGTYWCYLSYNGIFNVEWDPTTQIITFNKIEDAEEAELKWYIEGNINGSERTTVELKPVGGNKYVAENVSFTQNPQETRIVNNFFISSTFENLYYGAELNGDGAYLENYTPLLIYGVTSGELYYQSPNWCYNDFYGTYTVEWDLNTHIVSFFKVSDIPEPTPDPIYLDSDYYIIGSNVNGKSWSLAEEDAKFVNMGDGIFEWNGEVLGTGFKINNGTWEYSDFNIGSGEKLVIGEPYYCVVSDSSGNIAFAENFTTLKNPKVILNVSKAPREITIIVTGEKEGVMKWYISGTFNNWAIGDDADAVELTDLGNNNYSARGIMFASDTANEYGYNTFKIVTSGWADQFGQGGSGIEFGDSIDEGFLDIVEGEGGACPIFYEGKYDVTWNAETHFVSFTESNLDNVNDIDADADSEVMYFTPDGIRVPEPSTGIYLKVQGKKVTKVIL